MKVHLTINLGLVKDQMIILLLLNKIMQQLMRRCLNGLSQCEIMVKLHTIIFDYFYYSHKLLLNGTIYIHIFN